MPDDAKNHAEDLPPGLRALVERAGKPGREHPPVERWNPPFCGDLDIRIAADGRWYYLGSPIEREPLVRLFASVLRRDADGRHYLVTPVEKVGITVDDAPFIAVEMHMQGEGDDRRITLRTNVGDIVEVGPDHPLRFDVEEGTGGLKPYVLVRGRLEALFSRALAHELAEYFEEREVDGQRTIGIAGNGVFYSASPADEVKVEGGMA